MLDGTVTSRIALQIEMTYNPLLHPEGSDFLLQYGIQKSERDNYSFSSIRRNNFENALLDCFSKNYEIYTLSTLLISPKAIGSFHPSVIVDFESKMLAELVLIRNQANFKREKFKKILLNCPFCTYYEKTTMFSHYYFSDPLIHFPQNGYKKIKNAYLCDNLLIRIFITPLELIGFLLLSLIWCLCMSIFFLIQGIICCLYDHHGPLNWEFDWNDRVRWFEKIFQDNEDLNTVSIDYILTEEMNNLVIRLMNNHLSLRPIFWSGVESIYHAAMEPGPRRAGRIAWTDQRTHFAIRFYENDAEDNCSVHVLK